MSCTLHPERWWKLRRYLEIPAEPPPPHHHRYDDFASHDVKWKINLSFQTMIRFYEPITLSVQDRRHGTNGDANLIKLCLNYPSVSSCELNIKFYLANSITFEEVCFLGVYPLWYISIQHLRAKKFFRTLLTFNVNIFSFLGAPSERRMAFHRCHTFSSCCLYLL